MRFRTRGRRERGIELGQIGCFDRGVTALSLLAKIEATSVSTLMFRSSVWSAGCARAFDSSGYGGPRRIIDVSGDGSNNMGPPVTIMRDDVLAAGITINGLPIMLTRGYATGPSIPNLDVY